MCYWDINLLVVVLVRFSDMLYWFVLVKRFTEE